MIFLRNVNRTILAYMLQANMRAEEGGSSLRRYAAKNTKIPTTAHKSRRSSSIEHLDIPIEAGVSKGFIHENIC